MISELQIKPFNRKDRNNRQKYIIFSNDESSLILGDKMTDKPERSVVSWEELYN